MSLGTKNVSYLHLPLADQYSPSTGVAYQVPYLNLTKVNLITYRVSTYPPEVPLNFKYHILMCLHRDCYGSIQYADTVL